MEICTVEWNETIPTGVLLIKRRKTNMDSIIIPVRKIFMRTTMIILGAMKMRNIIMMKMQIRDVGTEFGVTRERIRQIEAKAIKRLKNNRKLWSLREFIY